MFEQTSDSSQRTFPSMLRANFEKYLLLVHVNCADQGSLLCSLYFLMGGWGKVLFWLPERPMDWKNPKLHAVYGSCFVRSRGLKFGVGSMRKRTKTCAPWKWKGNSVRVRARIALDAHLVVCIVQGFTHIFRTNPGDLPPPGKSWKSSSPVPDDSRNRRIFRVPTAPGKSGKPGKTGPDLENLEKQGVSGKNLEKYYKTWKKFWLYPEKAQKTQQKKYLKKIQLKQEVLDFSLFIWTKVWELLVFVRTSKM